MRVARVGIVILLLAGATGAASDFLTEGVDNARTGWVRDEKVFTTANVGSMKLLWKLKLESKPRAMHNLFAPLVAERVTTAQGPRELAVVAGVSDDLFGIDVASGGQIWHRRFDSTLTKPGGTTILSARRPDGRAHDGSDLARQVHRLRDLLGRSPAAGQSRGRARHRSAREVHPRRRQAVHSQPAQRRPLHRHCTGLRRIDQRVLLVRSGLTPRERVHPLGGGLWGRRGAAIDPEGRVFLGTGDAMFDPLTRRLGNGIVGVKLDANKQLQLVDYFGAPNANWLWRRDLDVNTTPIALDYRGRKFLIGTSKECRLWLLDRDSLGGEDHRTTLQTTPLICNDAQAFDAKGVWGALGAWQDDKGVQWVLAPFWGPVNMQVKAPVEHARPTGGGVAAFKLEERGGKWQLTPAWLSRDMDLAEEAVIANGVLRLTWA